jgi:hypothetical protein
MHAKIAGKRAEPHSSGYRNRSPLHLLWNHSNDGKSLDSCCAVAPARPVEGSLGEKSWRVAWLVVHFLPPNHFEVQWSKYDDSFVARSGELLGHKETPVAILAFRPPLWSEGWAQEAHPR